MTVLDRAALRKRINECGTPTVSLYVAEALSLCECPVPTLPPLPEGFETLEERANQAGNLSVQVSGAALARLCRWVREASK